MNADLDTSDEYVRPAVDAGAAALRNRYGRSPPVHAAEIVLAAVAPVVEAMCHWEPGSNETHEAFHYGNVCPYWAISQLLQGEPDPRRDP